MLSCAYRSTEEIINQSRVDTRLTREDGHLQRHTSPTSTNQEAGLGQVGAREGDVHHIDHGLKVIIF